MLIDYKNELNEDQYKAVTTTDGFLCIIAGAGSGKTRVLVYRLAYLIESGISPEQILMLTFTNKAANEMKERASKILDERCAKVLACTFHSFCNLMLHKYGKAIGYEKYTVLAPGDVKAAIRLVIGELRYSDYKGFPSAQVIAGLLSTSVNTETPLETVIKIKASEYQDYKTEIKRVCEGYADYKQKNRYVDFDDLLTLMIRLLDEHPGIAEKISKTYRYIMCDEYQDTNVLQEKILIKLRKPGTNLAVVGDDAQSIYGFRGAEVKNIIDFEKKFPGCQWVTLRINYRSTKQIVRFSNAVINGIEWGGAKKDMKGTYESKQLPMSISTMNGDTADQFITTLIKRMIVSGKDPNEIAVLSRSGKETGNIETLLMKAGIEFDKYGGQKFYDKEHVQKFMSLIRVMLNPYDELAYFVSLTLIRNIGDRAAREMSGACKEQGRAALTNKKYKHRAFTDLLNEYVRRLNRTGNKNSTQDKLKALYDLYEFLRTYDIDHSKSDRKLEMKDMLKDELEDIRTIMNIAEQYDSLSEFLEDLTLDKQKEETESKKVILSTIHSAKGLEFDTVFVLNCVDGMFPRTTRPDDPEDGEELRCFYVAITRAKRSLYLMSPEYVYRFGSGEYTEESHFITNVSDDLYLSKRL